MMIRDDDGDVSALLKFFSTAETLPPDGSDELLTVLLGWVGHDDLDC